jgi:hypothetical protein
MQTTEMYTRADPSVKLEALEAMIAPNLRSGRFKADGHADRVIDVAPHYAERKSPKMNLRGASPEEAPHKQSAPH